MSGSGVRMATLVRLVPLMLAACATSSPGERTRTAPDLGPGVKGGIAWLRHDDYLLRESVWDAGRVVAGPRGGPPSAGFTRTPDGRWRGGGEHNETIELAVEGSRLTGPTVDVTFTRVEGGFRLAGLWFRRNVDLVVDAKGARDHATRYVRDVSGAYVSTDLPNPYVFLVGDAARLEDPPRPELALAALVAGWGVH